MTKLQIFYDGACPLCSREIDHYRRRDSHKVIDYVDISAPGFSAARFGLESLPFHKYIHIRTQNGEFMTGIDAFNEIWKALNIFRPLSWAVEASLTRPLLKLGYLIFAEIRPFLPKRKNCETGCQI